MTNKHYIFVHNTELIEYFETSKKFHHLKNYQYVLLSNNHFGNVDGSVIVARNCDKNIEKYNNYLQFTGWYCLVANKIINTDYVTLMEYDVNIHRDLDNIIEQEVSKDNLPCYGYARLPKTNSFLNNDIFSCGLINYLKSININHNDIINDNLNNDWLVTSNITIRTDILNKLVKSDLFIGLLNYLQNDKYSGHFLERFTTVYLTLNKLQYRCIENDKGDILRHYAVDSHNTQGRHNEYLKYKELI